MGLLTLGCIIPQPNDATSWYRAYGPLRYCRNNVELIQIDAERCNWSDFHRCDALFIQRPAVASDVYLPIFEMANRVNIPIWTDYDDLLIDVPPWNPLSSRYNSKMSIKTVRESIMASKIVTVSTRALRAALLAEFPAADIRFVPNCWQDSLNIDFSAARTNSPFRMMWRGGGSHGFDLQIAAEFFMGLPENVELTFLGHMPEYAFFGSERWKIIKDHMMPPEFLETMGKQMPHLVIVPLVDHPFNHCKSDIAFLEATMCGAVCLAPKWNAWENPGCFNYDPQKSFTEQAMALLDSLQLNPELITEQNLKAREYIRENRLASKRGKADRQKVLRDLVSNS